MLARACEQHTVAATGVIHYTQDLSLHHVESTSSLYLRSVDTKCRLNSQRGAVLTDAKHLISSTLIAAEDTLSLLCMALPLRTCATCHEIIDTTSI